LLNNSAKKLFAFDEHGLRVFDGPLDAYLSTKS
jgi:hypothetical protein